MHISSSQKAFLCLEKVIATDVEEFWVLALNSNLELIKKGLLFRGTADSCLVHPRDIIRFVCRENATSFVIAHNHPSGDPRPSAEDIRITKKIFQIGQLIEVPLKDHLIISRGTYFSFADHGLFKQFANLKLLRLRS